MIGFEGNTRTWDKVLRRVVHKSGEYFNKSNIKEVFNNTALNYFNPEKISQDISLADDSTKFQNMELKSLLISLMHR